MKFFDNIRLEIFYKNGVSIRTNDWWLVNFSGDGVDRCRNILNPYYDVDDGDKLKIIGVDEL